MGMFEHVKISRRTEDGLTEWIWKFWYDNRTLWLDFYGEFTRPTRRHGFTRTQCYSRIDARGSDMTETDVVLPSDLKGEAIKKFCDGITVKRWSER